jgi:uncharacterized protein YcbX
VSATEQNATVASLWRYPVKSMMGEELNAAVVTEGGLVGDRAYALVDQETGKVVSAKNPKKWPDFFAFRAAYAEPPQPGGEVPPVWITLPNGDQVRSDDGGASEKISGAVARTVSLQQHAPRSPALEQYWPERDGEAEDVTNEAIAGAAPEGTFFDYATIHILTTGTLNKLRELYPQGRFEARRFRPNLVIETDPAVVDFVENAWVGKVLQIGEVHLQVTDPCPRCVMPTLAQGDLPKDPGIMKTMMANTVYVPFVERALPSVGVYAKVLRGGTIRRRDTVAVQ